MFRKRNTAAVLLISALGAVIGAATPAMADFCGDAICVYENTGATGPVEGFNFADSNLNNGNHFSDGQSTNDNIESIDSWSSDSARFYTNSLFRGNTEDVAGGDVRNTVRYPNQYSSLRPLI